MSCAIQQHCTVYFFFFSSRRRHTRFDCDWSSDVCSSDLRTPIDIAITLPCPAFDPSEKPFYSRAVTANKISITRSEEHTSELQSQSNLVCRLLLEKKKTTN